MLVFSNAQLFLFSEHTATITQSFSCTVYINAYRCYSSFSSADIKLDRIYTVPSKAKLEITIRRSIAYHQKFTSFGCKIKLKSILEIKLFNNTQLLQLGPSQDELEENRKLYQEYYKLKGVSFYSN